MDSGMRTRDNGFRRTHASGIRLSHIFGLNNLSAILQLEPATFKDRQKQKHRPNQSHVLQKGVKKPIVGIETRDWSEKTPPLKLSTSLTENASIECSIIEGVTGRCS
jgi:hypothetical protein